MSAIPIILFFRLFLCKLYTFVTWQFSLLRVFSAGGFCGLFRLGAKFATEGCSLKEGKERNPGKKTISSMFH